MSCYFWLGNCWLNWNLCIIFFPICVLLKIYFFQDQKKYILLSVWHYNIWYCFSVAFQHVFCNWIILNLLCPSKNCYTFFQLVISNLISLVIRPWILILQDLYVIWISFEFSFVCIQIIICFVPQVKKHHYTNSSAIYSIWLFLHHSSQKHQ